MATDQHIKSAIERAHKAIGLRSSLAVGTMTSSLRLEDGLKCRYTCGDWNLELDEPESVGGEESAPMPGVYALAGLSGCTAMTIKIQAILAGIKVDAVNLDIEADYDDSNMLGLNPGAPSSYTGFRLNVNVESDAPEAEIREVVQKALETSMWHAVFAGSQSLVPSVRVTPTAQAAVS